MTNEPARKINGKFMVHFSIGDGASILHTGKFNYYDTSERRVFAERSLEAIKAGHIVTTRKA